MGVQRASSKWSRRAAFVVGLCSACSACTGAKGATPATPRPGSPTQPRVSREAQRNAMARDPSAVVGSRRVGTPPSVATSARPEASSADSPCPAPEIIETLPPLAPPQHFSVDGYRMRYLTVHRELVDGLQLHCVQVAWPPGERNSAGQPCHVATTIDDAWLRAIANTLARVPWGHVQLLRRIVIDNRPVEHGIAPYSRDRADDARDGHTIWLHEHLFLDPNHYARGNYGRYWSYHVNVDNTTIDGAPAEHDLFSPVLLHELGHLVAYHLVNVGRAGAETANVPGCATTCRDDGTCAGRSATDRERGCISPYCGPLRLPGSSENWAEQYRFFYQGSVTRAIVLREFRCAQQLTELDQAGEGTRAPWVRGLPDLTLFHPSRWSSCGERACKPY